MAFDYFLDLVDYKGTHLVGESQSAIHTGCIEVSDVSWSLEQVLNIGSQTTGAGAGKMKFNSLKFSKHVDCVTAAMFQNCAAGTPFKTATLFCTKAGGLGAGQYVDTFVVKMGLVAVKSISYGSSEEAVTEEIEVEFGQMQYDYYQQKSDGTLMAAKETVWNRVKNNNAWDSAL